MDTTFTFTETDEVEADEVCAECEALGWTTLCNSCQAHTLTFAAAITEEINR